MNINNTNSADINSLSLFLREFVVQEAGGGRRKRTNSSRRINPNQPVPFFPCTLSHRFGCCHSLPALLRGDNDNSSSIFEQFIVSYFTPNSSLFRAHLPAKRGAIIAAGAVSNVWCEGCVPLK
uniref:Uncharacterized protein n=1 Tax=Globodera rostochiensis TaxID=31243 RepID=A0A914IDV5_GLORO